MVLADKTIKEYIKSRRIVIVPFNDACVQPSSVDLHLGNDFLVFDNYSQGMIDTKGDVSSFMKRVEINNNEPIIVHPREFILGTTEERVEVPADLVARLEGKSSLGRIGLVIHSTAGYVDPGFKGQLTLEISNLSNLPIALYAGMRICQISFIQMTTTAEFPYGSNKLVSHYQGQKGTVGSNLGSAWGVKSVGEKNKK